MNNALKAGSRLFAYQLIGALIALILLVPLGGAGWLMVLLNIAFLAAYALMLWSDSCQKGQSAATLSATLERQRAEGRRVDPKNERDAYRPNEMWIAYVIGTTPFLLLALFNLAFAGDWSQAICRMAFAPYVSVFVYLDSNRPLLNWLFVALALILPLLLPIGYMQGPKLRQKKLDAIAKGVKKKMRQLRVNQKKRQPPKPPKMEV